LEEKDSCVARHQLHHSTIVAMLRMPTDLTQFWVNHQILCLEFTIFCGCVLSRSFRDLGIKSRFISCLLPNIKRFNEDNCDQRDQEGYQKL